jgi:hypothetical protein
LGWNFAKQHEEHFENYFLLLCEQAVAHEFGHITLLAVDVNFNELTMARIPLMSSKHMAAKPVDGFRSSKSKTQWPFLPIQDLNRTSVTLTDALSLWFSGSLVVKASVKTDTMT